VIHAAGVMLVSPQGRVLLLQRSDAGDHAGEWCFPGGGVEPGETAADAASRECLEETGYRVGSPGALLCTRVNDGVHFTTFQARVDDEFEPRLNKEHTAFAWVAPDEALEQDSEPDIFEPDDGRADAAEFREEDHPRAKDGKFGSGDGKPASVSVGEENPFIGEGQVTRLNAALEKYRVDEDELNELRELFPYDPSNYTSRKPGKSEIDPDRVVDALGQIDKKGLNLTVSQAVAVRLYADPSLYESLNKGLRGGKLTPREEAVTVKICEALDRLPPYKGAVERAINLTPAALKKYVPGSVVTNKAFTSTSVDLSKYSTGFRSKKRNTRFVIEGKTGREIGDVVRNPGNVSEVLFKPGAKFRVKSHETRDGIAVITMEEESNDEALDDRRADADVVRNGPGPTKDR